MDFSIKHLCFKAFYAYDTDGSTGPTGPTDPFVSVRVAVDTEFVPSHIRPVEGVKDSLLPGYQ